ADDLVRRADALLRAALHEALEVRRTVLAGEVDVALAHAFVAAEARVLADPPIRVRAEEVRIGDRSGEHGLAVPLAADPRIDLLDLLEIGLRGLRDVLVRRRRRVRVRLAERGRHVCPGVLDEDPCRASLAARDVPTALERQVGVDRACAALSVPD